MSDGMAFLTGAAFAGVAVLFMLKGGNNIVANTLPSSQQLPVTPTSTPYNPYVTTPQTPIPASPNSTPYNYDPQGLDNQRLRAMLDQQRLETEQLKAQLQNQQLLIERLSAQTNNPSASSTWSKPASTLAPNQQEENPVLSGLVWGLGGMAVTVSGGLVVVGALAMLSRQQQRPSRTTYVVQQPYTALPPSMQQRRRTEVIHPQVEERHIDYVDYDR